MTVTTTWMLKVCLALVLLMTMVACFEATGGDVSPLPGNDASVPTCDQCPEGEQCHPEARICVPCPNGECAQAADAAQAIPVVDAGPLGGGTTGGTPMQGGAMMAGAMMTPDMGLPMPDMMPSGGGSTTDAAQCIPDEEVCDGEDNDCDGNTDEETNLLNDVANCGACSVRCETVPNASARCVDGQCGYRCDNGFEDSDGEAENGCEQSGIELSFVQPEDAAAIRDDFQIELSVKGIALIGLVELSANGQVLVRRGPQATVTFDVRLEDIPAGPVTLQAEAFDLNGASAYTVSLQIIVDGEDPVVRFIEPTDNALINGSDAFDITIRISNETEQVSMTLATGDGDVLGERAQDGNQSFVFNIDPATIGPGAKSLVATATDEAGNTGSARVNLQLRFCLADEMVDIIELPAWRFRIDRYEASLYDATAISRGVAPDAIIPDDDTLICSRGGVIPWYGANYLNAQASCQAAGKRLCTPEEFARACSGAAGRDYPYGEDYRDDVCNGGRNDERGERPFVASVPDLLPTGFKSECYQREGRANPNNRIYDLSGNLAEWTLTNLFGEGVSGGHFDALPPNALECGYRQEINPGQLRDEFGFRCCQDIE